MDTQNKPNKNEPDKAKAVPGIPPIQGARDAERPKIRNWMINLLGILIFVSAFVSGYLIYALWPETGILVEKNVKVWASKTYLFGSKAGCEVTTKGACHYIELTSEQRIIILVLLAGALGSFIHAASSFSNYVGESKIEKSWVWWYILRPPVGMSIALVFYLVFRGGLVNDTPIETLNVYGILTLAALSGLFTDRATLKLEEIFQSLFKPDDKRKDKLRDKGEEITGDENAKG